MKNDTLFYQRIDVESLNPEFLFSDFFLTELAAPSFFSYHVTFPLLYCVETSDQTKLCEILYKLHKDLQDSKTDTLSEFTMPMYQYKVTPLTTDFQKLLLKKICKGAASGVEMQSYLEYFKDIVDNNPHATQICDLTADELEGVPTNNLVCVRNLSIFDRLTKNAKWANRKFTAANIKNTMTLKGHAPVEVTANARRAVPLLVARLATWNNSLD